MPGTDAALPEYDRSTVPEGLGHQAAVTQEDADARSGVALDQAMAARQTCGQCRRQFYIYLSKKLGCCLECFDGRPVDPSSLMTLPAPAVHRLAA